ncbi:hypothetical protein ACL6C3_06180 [Capilliphycus salinus ALCB114379]|uniref:hypothetical protein n=1 Tax=Capilliphycus salinus TaxID=2768948 RepID=UPI0039A73274
MVYYQYLLSVKTSVAIFIGFDDDTLKQGETLIFLPYFSTIFVLNIVLNIDGD